MKSIDVYALALGPLVIYKAELDVSASIQVKFFIDS